MDSDDSTDYKIKTFDYLGLGGLGSLIGGEDAGGKKLERGITKNKIKFSKHYDIVIHKYLGSLDSKLLGISTQQDDPMSPVSSEVIDYINEIKRSEIKKLQLKPTKIKVCTLYYLISRKHNRAFSLKEIEKAVSNLTPGKKAAEKQRKMSKKKEREKKELAPYQRFSTLLQDKHQFEELVAGTAWRLSKFPSLGLDVSKRPSEIWKYVNRLDIKDENLERKLLRKVEAKMKIIDQVNRKTGEFMSKKQPGKIATVMWLSIKELKNDGWVFEIPTTQEVISITCGINISTLQKNLKDFKELF